MLRSSVLIVEDDEAARKQLEWALRDEFDVLTAENSAGAVAIARDRMPRVILLDLGLPPNPTDPEEGFRVLREIRQCASAGKIIVCTGYGQREHAVRAIELGAYDFFTKPVDVDLLKILLRRICWVSELEQEQLTRPGGPGNGTEEMIGTSASIRGVFAAIRKVAPVDVAVLITGESGTGKELTAKTVHRLSQRAKGPFVAINCGAIPETLLESELFGHERGAFTGAVQQMRGKVEYAQGGTLFLDEVGDLAPALQVKLLRFLQDHAIERVGGRHQIGVDARIIAATNRDLAQATAEGRFREDLFYRLGVVHLHIPALREREEDLLLMARTFLIRIAEEMGKRVHGFTRESIQAVRAYPWPGNVRELSNRVRRAVIMTEGAFITPEDLELLPPTGLGAAPPTSLRDARERLEREIIAQALALHDGNLTQVAEELRISRPTLYAHLRKYRIQGRV
jgi:two-component system NtrC family response regulator